MSGRRAQTLPAQLSEEKPPRGKCLKGLCFMWKVFTCLVSHVTLVLLVVCYCVGGAYLFQHLEKPHEIEVKKGIKNIRYNLTDKIWKFSDNTSVLSESDWISNVEKDLINFEKQILTALKSDGWDGSEDITKTQWTFAGSLFYSIIVITTIGYGHISPHTDWGKVTTIFYAIMGIPLMLLCLSNIGDVMATSFRFIYWRVCCYVCTRKSRPRSRSRQRSVYSQRHSQHTHRSQQASLHRSHKRQTYETQLGLPHAHSDPELRHIGRRDLFATSRSELRDAKRLQHHNIHEDNYHYDTGRCAWDCDCRREYNELPRRHNRARSDYDTHAGRHSTHSARYMRPMPHQQPERYSLSLPRGRSPSRRMRARTVDPHYIEQQSRPHVKKMHHYTHNVIQQPYESRRPLDTDLLHKTPVITNRYAIDDLNQDENHLRVPKNKLRSHSMPRATHLRLHDALYAYEEADEETEPRRKRNRAMSVMPRHHSAHARDYELSEFRPSHNRTECCSADEHNYYIDDTHAHHDNFTHGSHHSHQSQRAHYAHRGTRKIARHERAEKLPPSPRIMSPLGFAVKRQTRHRSSFDLEDDIQNGWHDYNGDMIQKNRPVPIWLCVFLVISYILGGAALFAYWENWSFLDSAYFCFITLTTIGFGDFVPAKGVKDESEQSIAYCSLYLLFGIALLAMSFNLVQEEFIANVKEVARRLGIIKEEEEDGDD